MKLMRIGTLIDGKSAVTLLPQLIPHGFESFSLTFWQTTGGIDLKEAAKRITGILAGKDIVISSVSVFGNPLTNEGSNADTLASWERLIDNARAFGADLVTGFTGRIPGKPIPDSLPRFTEVFSALARRAKDNGVRIAFENCSMGGTWQSGDWNIAHNPAAWELMFNALKGIDNAGLQWEPCHQLVQLIDIKPQLRKWTPKIFNIHGKDATIAWDIIREHGIQREDQFAWHRTPGFGDSNWADIISILLQNGYKGTIDIEGFHDPVYGKELEMTGQVRALNYLKECRGGTFVPNPV